MDCFKFDTCKQLLSLTVASACSCQGLRAHKTVRPLRNQGFSLLSLVGARLLSLSTWKLMVVVLKQQQQQHSAALALYFSL